MHHRPIYHILMGINHLILLKQRWTQKQPNKRPPTRTRRGLNLTQSDPIHSCYATMISPQQFQKVTLGLWTSLVFLFIYLCHWIFSQIHSIIAGISCVLFISYNKQQLSYDCTPHACSFTEIPSQIHNFCYKNNHRSLAHEYRTSIMLQIP